MSENIEEFLEHHGIRGMKWGVRRAKNHGSGSHHANSGRKPKGPGAYTSNPKETADARNARLAKEKVKKGGIEALNNKELKDLVNRMNLEQQYSNLSPKSVSKGRTYLKNAATLGKGVNTAIQFYKSPAGQMIKTGVISGAKYASQLVK